MDFVANSSYTTPRLRSMLNLGQSAIVNKRVAAKAVVYCQKAIQSSTANKLRERLGKHANLVSLLVDFSASVSSYIDCP